MWRIRLIFGPSGNHYRSAKRRQQPPGEGTGDTPTAAPVGRPPLPGSADLHAVVVLASEPWVRSANARVPVTLAHPAVSACASRRADSRAPRNGCDRRNAKTRSADCTKISKSGCVVLRSTVARRFAYLAKHCQAANDAVCKHGTPLAAQTRRDLVLSALFTLTWFPWPISTVSGGL